MRRVITGTEDITGYFVSVDVPAELKVGSDILATIDFYAINPGALYWSTFLIVDSEGLPLLRMLDKAREIGQEGGREKTYNLGKMPDRLVGFSFFLFGHDDASYDWDWQDYERWKLGAAVPFKHLDSAYRFITPIEEEPPEPEPPDEVEFSGVITRVVPDKISYGKPIDLIVDFNAYCESLYYQIRGWQTRLSATLDGLSDSDIQWHYGRDGSRTGQTLNLGAMPGRNISGTLILEGRGAAVPAKPWEELDRRSWTVQVVGGPPPPEVYPCPYCPETFSTQEELLEHVALVHPEKPPPTLPEEKKFPWGAALIGVGAVVLIAAALPKEKKSS